jgi:hypothetical protein
MLFLTAGAATSLREKVSRASLSAREYALPARPNLACHYKECAHLQGISDIKIVGIDERRPPMVRKEPYIDIFFKLSHQAPEEWCEDFNKLTSKSDPAIRIDKNKGLFIDTYVRGMNDIQAHLDKIQRKISVCNEQYIENIRQAELASAEKNSSLLGQGGEQAKLNTIVASLRYGE